MADLVYDGGLIDLDASGDPVVTGEFYSDALDASTTVLPMQDTQNDSQTIAAATGNNGTLTHGGDTPADRSVAGPTAWLPLAQDLSNGTVHVDLAAAQANDQPFTFMWWEDFSSGDSFPYWFGQDPDNNTLIHRHGGDLHLGGWSGNALATPGRAGATGWAHRAIKSDGSTVTAYLNGAVAGTDSTISPSGGSISRVIISGRVIGQTTANIGPVAQWCHAPEALSDEEIAAIYAGPAPTVAAITLTRDGTKLVAAATITDPGNGSITTTYLFQRQSGATWVSVQETSSNELLSPVAGETYRVIALPVNNGGVAKQVDSNSAYFGGYFDTIADSWSLAGDLAYKSSVALRETFDDDTTIGTVNGTAAYVDGQYGGRAFNFNGSTRIEHPQTLPIGAAARAVFVRFQVAQGNHGFLFGQSGGGNGEAFRLRARDGTGQGTVNALRAEFASAYQIGSTVFDNDWHTAAIVVPTGAADTDDVVVYLDGSPIVVSGSATQSLVSAAANFWIGNDPDAGAGLVGQIDELIGLSDSLPASQVVSLSAGPTPHPLTAPVVNENGRTSAGTYNGFGSTVTTTGAWFRDPTSVITDVVGHFRFYGDTVDARGNVTPTIEGAAATYVNAQHNRQGLAISESGTTGVVVSAADFDRSSGSWSAACWIRHTNPTAIDTANKYGGIIGQRAGAGEPNVAAIRYENLAGIGIVNYNGSGYDVITDSTPDMAAWNHVVVMYDDATGELTFYVNGTLGGTLSSGLNANWTSGDLVFGDEYGFNGTPDAILQDCVVLNRKLTPAEITSLAGGPIDTGQTNPSNGPADFDGVTGDYWWNEVPANDAGSSLIIANPSNIVSYTLEVVAGPTVAVHSPVGIKVLTGLYSFTTDSTQDIFVAEKYKGRFKRTNRRKKV